ncbi:hypothetical protein [Candidatus Amarolinea dominans]|uniref:hypothetical protein n=1 Tax=Candidatus Amarolinea dominans TaxID=3140696 RepID=UPI003136472C|nr:hypothetical protein [Anaerolineae bacterium]
MGDHVDRQRQRDHSGASGRLGLVESAATPGSLWLVNTIADSGTGSLALGLTNAGYGDRIEFAARLPPGNPGRICGTSWFRIGVGIPASDPIALQVSWRHSRWKERSTGLERQV